MLDFDRAYHDVQRSMDRKHSRCGPGPWSAFSENWFRQHQGKLLGVLNHPYLKYPVRDILRISPICDKREIITGIGPNRFTTMLGNGKVATRFHVNQKYARRLYFGFKPVWWAMHSFDWSIADRFLPALSFGFSTLTAYPDEDPETDTVDGFLEHTSADDTWTNLVNGAGNFSNDNGTAFYTHLTTSDGVTDTWFRCTRGATLFDTSAIGSEPTVTLATWNVYFWSRVDQGNWYQSGEGVVVVSCNPASNTALVDGDFDSFGSTLLSDEKVWADFATEGYVSFALNASGRAAIAKTGISKFGTRDVDYDIGDTPGTWSDTKSSYYRGYCADQAGSSNDPYLYVEYTTPGPTAQVHHRKQQGIQ